MKDEEYKYDYGEAVIISKNAPEKFLPGEFGSICAKGITDIEYPEGSGCFIETNVYTVEYGDGSDNEIPEYYLEPYIE